MGPVRLFGRPGVAELDHVKTPYFDDLGIGDPGIDPVDAKVDLCNLA